MELGELGSGKKKSAVDSNKRKLKGANQIGDSGGERFLELRNRLRE